MDIVDYVLIKKKKYKKVRELVREISKIIEGQTISLICILKTAPMFLCDLAKHIRPLSLTILCRSQVMG